MNRFDLVLQKMRELDTDGVQSLEIAVMEKHKKSLGEYFEACVTYVVGEFARTNTPFDLSNALDGIGYNFHKGLRQFDVTGSGELDMIIWLYLRDGKAVFWDACRQIDLGLEQ